MCSDGTSRWLRVGSVRCFDEVRPSKEQACKVLEEAAEVFGAWQGLSRRLEAVCEGGGVTGGWSIVESRTALLDECADVIQAVSNMVHSLGVEDFRPYVDACERRNRDRGRISDGGSM